MAKLTPQERKNLPTKDFAGPNRSYPIQNASHARNALSRVSQNGSSKEKDEVRAKVHAKYPSIGSSSQSGVSGAEQETDADESPMKKMLKGALKK